MSDVKYNQIIDDAYKAYIKRYNKGEYVGKTKLLENSKKNRTLTEPFTQEEFINKIKTDNEFSKTWGLKIEERVLSHEERCKIVTGKDLPYSELNNSDKYKVDYMYEHNIPTKLITVTYNNETIEVYE